MYIFSVICTALLDGHIFHFFFSHIIYVFMYLFKIIVVIIVKIIIVITLISNFIVLLSLFILLHVLLWLLLLWFLLLLLILISKFTPQSLHEEYRFSHFSLLSCHDANEMHCNIWLPRFVSSQYVLSFPLLFLWNCYSLVILYLLLLVYYIQTKSIL